MTGSVKITLNNGTSFLIDKEDEEKLRGRKMYPGWCGYPQVNVDGKLVQIHRYIMNAKAGEIVDHINTDKLDTRKQNLRIVSRSLNSHNRARPSHRKLTSKYRGVSLISGKWKAGFGAVLLGNYHSEDDAARAYNEYVTDKFGSDARVNNVDMSIPYEKITMFRKTNGRVKKNKNGKFAASFVYLRQHHFLGSDFTNEEEARNAIVTHKRILENAHLSPPEHITRNADGHAIIKIQDSEMICDDEIWKLYVNRKMHISYYGYVMLGKKSFHRTVFPCPDHLFVDHINR